MGVGARFPLSDKSLQANYSLMSVLSQQQESFFSNDNAELLHHYTLKQPTFALSLRLYLMSEFHFKG